jgi:6-phosphogluconolactonase
MLHRNFPSSQALVSTAAEALLEAFQAPAPSPCSIMLAGGGTPQPVYAEVARRGIKAAPNVTAFFSDERMVPRDDPQSNYGSARPMLLSLGLEKSGHALSVSTELPLDEAAAAYEARLRGLLAPPNRIALGVLGIGSDGHTASLFSLHDIARGRGRLAIPVSRVDGPDRVSVTADFLGHVERVLFLVVGPEKAAIATRILEDPSQIIAMQAVKGCGQVEVWTADLLL